MKFLLLFLCAVFAQQQAYKRTYNFSEPYEIPPHVFREIPDAQRSLCQLRNQKEAMCIRKNLIKDETQFCYKFLPEFVCVPVQHYLWDSWNITAKDFKI